MKITGELLKSERLKKNLTVQDVAFALKLSPKIITSIESGETENLPAKTFIRGFVKGYAQFLKIDSDQVMRQFQEEMGTTHPMPKGVLLSSPQSSDSHIKVIPDQDKPIKKTSVTAKEQTKVLSDSKNNRSFIYIGVAVVLVILIVATNRLADRYQKERVLNPQDISNVKPLDPNQSQPVTAATPIETIAAPIETTTQQITPSLPTSTPAASQPVQSTEATVTTPLASVGEIDDGFELSNGKPVEVVIEAKKDIEIYYARGNTKSFSKLNLTAKQIQVIRSTSGLHIKAEDGGAFHIVVNGLDKGAAGSNSKPVRLSY